MAKKVQTQTGARAIRAIFEDQRRSLEDEKPPEWQDPHLPRDGVLPGKWPGHPFAALPPDCPIKVIGFDVEGATWCLTSLGYLRKIEKFDATTIAGLFSPYTDFLQWAWPAWGEMKIIEDGVEKKKQVIKRIEVQQCALAIQTEAGRKTVFDAHTQHRGRGGWEDSQGNFLWHSGGWLWKSENNKLIRARPAMHEKFLYTRDRSTIEPWSAPVTADESPARRILDDLKTWNWQRPYLDPLLVVGWLATAIMGGALKARPIVFTTGGKGVGKSTMHELVRNTLDGMVTSAVDTTAAGIYQKARHDALPFLVDELESKPGSHKSQSVIELARVAYTGGDIARGGADHEGTTFRMHSSFFFSAINPPPMGSQDKSRMAILNLSRLDKSDGIGRKLLASIETDGRMLLRQVLDGWREFQDRLLPDYWQILQAQGLDSRGIDTYGTLLASAELLVGPEAMEDCGLAVTDQNRLGEIVMEATALERNEDIDNWHRCMNILLDSTIDAWRDGIKPTIGSVCERLLMGEYDLQPTRERLALVNLGMTNKDHVSGNYCLAVPKDGPMLAHLFAGTEFHQSVWFDALKQAPPYIVRRGDGSKHKFKIGGVTKHCLLIDLTEFQKHTSDI